MKRSPHHTWRTGVVILGALGLVAAACGDDDEDSSSSSSGSEPSAEPSAELSPGIQDLVDQASEEGGELVLTWGQYNQPDLLSAWEEDFEATYGIDLSISNTPNPNFNENASQVVSEKENDRTASTDVLLATSAHTLIARDGEASEAVDWESLEGNVAALIGEHGDEMFEADDTAVHFHTTLYGVTYNLDEVDEEAVPDELEALAELPDDIALATTPQASSFQYLADESLWGEESLRQWFDQYAARVDGLVAGSDLDRLTSGEFDVLALDWGKSFSDVANAQGANLGWKMLSDAALIDYVSVVPMVHGPHPATAKLFVDYLLGSSAQEILFEHALVDLHLIEGSASAEVIAGAEADGIELAFRDADLNEASPHISEEVRPDLIATLEQQGGG